MLLSKNILQYLFTTKAIYPFSPLTSRVKLDSEKMLMLLFDLIYPMAHGRLAQSPWISMWEAHYCINIVQAL